MIVDLPRRVAIGLNPVASVVWTMAVDFPLADIATALTKSFEVTQDTAVRDAEAFLATLEERGLIEVA